MNHSHSPYVGSGVEWEWVGVIGWEGLRTLKGNFFSGFMTSTSSTDPCRAGEREGQEASEGVWHSFLALLEYDCSIPYVY